MVGDRGIVTKEGGKLFARSLGGGEKVRLMPLPPPPSHKSQNPLL